MLLSRPAFFLAAPPAGRVQWGGLRLHSKSAEQRIVFLIKPFARDVALTRPAGGGRLKGADAHSRFGDSSTHP